MKSGRNFARGTVSLVALCFIAVLGIALSSYLAICSRSMTLSNRSFQSGLGQQLAELGLEEGLRAFNKGDWSGWSANPSGITGATTAWTLDATNKRASRTLTFDSTRLGQNVTATVKIRIDNYDANVLGGSTYNASTTYRINDIVYYNGTANVAGTWYRSVQNGNTGHNPLGLPLSYPDLNYWAPLPIPWMWSPNTSYKQYDIVCYNGTWYYSNNSPNASATFIASNWTALPVAPILAITAPTAYVAGTFAFLISGSTWYRCTAPHTLTAWTSAGGKDNWTPVGAIPTWAYNTSTTYNYDDLVFYSGTGGVPGTWYRCKVATTGPSAFNAADWENALIGSNTTSAPGAQGWSSSTVTYNLGDTVCYASGGSYNFYRCIRTHISSGSIIPTNTTYWAPTPLLSQDWQPNHQYSQNDTVRYKGVWYLSLTSTSNVGRLPTDASSGYWAAAPRGILPWNATNYYELDDIVLSGTTWYRCIKPHKNQAAPNSTYWTVLVGSASSYVWNAGTAYSSGDYRSYGGAWYKCTAATLANDGHTPNDSGYWSASWSQPSTSVTTGAPIVYAEATITIAGSPPIKTQIRAPIAPAPLFPNAVGSNTTLKIGGAGTVDAYDGSVRSMNTNGTTATFAHDESTNAPFLSSNHNVGFTASLAATGTTFPALSIDSTTVKGFGAASPASTSPYAPLVSFGTSTKLQNSDGTMASPHASALNVDLTRISGSPYVPTFATQPAGDLGTAFTAANFPAGSSIPMTGISNLVLGIPGAATPARYYYNTDMIIGSGSLVTVTIIGPVILYINGDLEITGGTSNLLIIAPTGSAEIHVAEGLKVRIAGNGVDNRTADPKKLTIICHATSNSQQLYEDGSTTFYGTIYMPYTTNSTGLFFNNGTTTTVHGAISAKTVEFDHNATVHYDTSLRYATTPGVDQPYMVVEWRELPIAEQATMP